MKTRKQEEENRIGLVTNPDACQSIVSAGRKLADDNKVELVLLAYRKASRAIGTIAQATETKRSCKSADAELTVVYQMTCMRQRTIPKDSNHDYGDRSPGWEQGRF